MLKLLSKKNFNTFFVDLEQFEFSYLKDAICKWKKINT